MTVRRRQFRGPLRYSMLLLVVYLSWLAMLAVHEFGHVLHAWISGGRVAAVHFGLFEFSQTELSSDPHPQFVAWGGPAWGCVIPIVIYLLVLTVHVPALRRLFCFFAGFCLIANGAYIGVGWTIGAGDAGTLLRHGASPWMMCVFGFGAMAGGLYLWHRLGNIPRRKLCDS